MTKGRIITLLNSIQTMDLSKNPYGYTEKELKEALNESIELIELIRKQRVVAHDIK